MHHLGARSGQVFSISEYLNYVERIPSLHLGIGEGMSLFVCFVCARVHVCVFGCVRVCVRVCKE